LIVEHNRTNAACAIASARALGVSDEKIAEALETFKGAPGRLEKIGEYSGVTIYNDTTSTTPEALEAALSSFSNDKRVILITGGADKGLDFSNVIPKMAAVAKHVIMTPGNGTTRIEPQISEACKAAGTSFTVAASTADAVALAKEVAAEGDIVLFSPAFASFAEFKNEYDRGDSYLRFVKDSFR
jgi:UDP-N-acetylmuramoylalanine--D-glutamate ligase